MLVFHIIPSVSAPFQVFSTCTLSFHIWYFCSLPHVLLVHQSNLHGYPVLSKPLVEDIFFPDELHWLFFFPGLSALFFDIFACFDVSIENNLRQGKCSVDNILSLQGWGPECDTQNTYQIVVPSGMFLNTTVGDVETKRPLRITTENLGYSRS